MNKTTLIRVLTEPYLQLKKYLNIKKYHKLKDLRMEFLGSLFFSNFIVDVSTRRPPEGATVHAQSGPFILTRSDVLIHQFGRDTNHVLSLPVFHHVHAL